MTPIEQLRSTLATLSLTAIDARLDALLETAAKKEPSYADFLAEVINTEADARRQRYLKARLQLAHLPYLKTFQQFDFSFQPSIDERQISELRTLRFVRDPARSARSRQDASCRSSGRVRDPGRTTRWDICRWMISAQPSSSSSAHATKGAASSLPLTRATANGARSSATRSSQPPSSAGCSTTPQQSTFAERVTGSRNDAKPDSFLCRTSKESSWPTPPTVAANEIHYELS